MPAKNMVEYGVVRKFVEKVGGEYAVDLVKICSKKKSEVTDEEIGKGLPLKITEIRAILNRLHYRGIAFYQKARNNKTGWYSYTWGVNNGRIVELILEEQKEEVKKLEKKLEYEQNYNFFACTDGCESFPFEIAAEYEFKCPKCGNIMNAQDNEKNVKRIKKEISSLKNQLCEIEKYGR